MPTDKNDLHPEMWKVPGVELTTTALGPDEEIRMAMSLEVITPKGKTYNIFAVVETPTDLSGRILLRHDESGVPTQYAAHEFVNYPKEDINKLVEEIRDKALGFATFIMEVAPRGMTIDTNVPVAYIQALGAGIDTRKILVEQFKTNTEPRANEVTNAILDVLKINDETGTGKTAAMRNLAQENDNFQIAPVMPQDEKLTNLAKAIQEQELIKKFGKKKVTELAKKMNYHGAVINKSK